jgi:hypothetical protein
MPINRVECSECGAALKSEVDLRPGKKVRCPKCQAVLIVPAPAPVRLVQAEKPARPTRPVEGPDEDREDEDRRNKKKAASKTGGLFAPKRLITLGVALLLVAGAVAFLVIKIRNRNADDGGPENPLLAADLQKDEKAQEMAKKVVGTWETLEDQGPHRILSLRSDGAFSDSDFAGAESRNGQPTVFSGKWKIVGVEGRTVKIGRQGGGKSDTLNADVQRNSDGSYSLLVWDNPGRKNITAMYQLKK